MQGELISVRLYLISDFSVRLYLFSDISVRLYLFSWHCTSCFGKSTTTYLQYNWPLLTMSLLSVHRKSFKKALANGWVFLAIVIQITGTTQPLIDELRLYHTIHVRLLSKILTQGFTLHVRQFSVLRLTNIVLLALKSLLAIWLTFMKDLLYISVDQCICHSLFIEIWCTATVESIIPKQPSSQSYQNNSTDHYLIV